MPAIADYVASQFPDTTAILDAGCGNGELMRLLLERDWNQDFLCGCDLEPGHVAVAQRRVPGVHIFCCAGQATALPFIPRIIAAINWLHHDWLSTHATGVEARPPNPLYPNAVLVNFRAIMNMSKNSLLIFDKPAPGDWLTSAGFEVVETHEHPPDRFHVAALRA